MKKKPNGKLKRDGSGPGKRKPTSRRPSSITLREAFEQHYDQSDLAIGTIKKYGFELNRWERYVPQNPSIDQITDETLAEFRKAALDDGMAPATVNMSRAAYRAILRRVGPRETKNPAAKGLLKSVPYMRPCKYAKSIPRRLELDDEISRFYIACQIMERPALGFPPPFWWQGLVVWLYTTGMRLRDALGIKFADVDLDHGIVRFTARKTLKAAEMPIHPVAVEHVRRMAEPKREFVFESRRLKRSGDFHHQWRRICVHAKLAAPFTPSDLRKTVASEINRAASEKRLPPMASTLLQHSSVTVTDTHYTNLIAELREALSALRLPVVFKHGPAEAQRRFDAKRAEAAQAMRRATLAPGAYPDPSQFDFQEFGFGIRGQYVRMHGGALRILQALVTSPTQRCELEQLSQAVWPNGGAPATVYARQGRVCGCISILRERLRVALHLPPAYDPVPCVARGTGVHGIWTLYLPTDSTKSGGT